MDPDCDCFDLFDEQRRGGRVEIIGRAKRDFDLHEDDRKLFEAMTDGAPDARVDVALDGLLACPESGSHQVLAARPGRRVCCDLHYRRLTLPPKSEDAESVRLWGVAVLETEPQ